MINSYIDLFGIFLGSVLNLCSIKEKLMIINLLNALTNHRVVLESKFFLHLGVCVV